MNKAVKEMWKGKKVAQQKQVNYCSQERERETEMEIVYTVYSIVLPDFQSSLQ